MSLSTEYPSKSEFYTRGPDNLLLVEIDDGAVTVRAARDNFSERRKMFFIRELAAEGFIPDKFLYFTNAEEPFLLGLSWIIDLSWLSIPQEILRISSWRFQALYFTGLAAELAVLILLFTFHA